MFQIPEGGGSCSRVALVKQSVQFTDLPNNAANWDRSARYVYPKEKIVFIIRNKVKYKTSHHPFFIYFLRNRNSLVLIWERGAKRKSVWQLIMKEPIQIIQMLALSPLLCSLQAVKGLFCPQRVMSAWPIENSRRALWDECPGWAQWPQFEYHADICQIGAPHKRKKATLLPFNHVVILLES